jgi:hypothetical protein
MNELNLIIRTADRARKAEITVSDSQTCSDLIEAAVENWALPKETNYTIANVTNVPAKILNPAKSLAAEELKAGDVLEIQPVLVAGGDGR